MQSRTPKTSPINRLIAAMAQAPNERLHNVNEAQLETKAQEYRLPVEWVKHYLECEKLWRGK